jgi:hypothetical protein
VDSKGAWSLDYRHHPVHRAGEQGVGKENEGDGEGEAGKSMLELFQSWERPRGVPGQEAAAPTESS